MSKSSVVQMPKRSRCAIYTRKSSEEGLDMEFNSLDAQREACEAYVCQSALKRDPLSASKRNPLFGYDGGARRRCAEP